MPRTSAGCDHSPDGQGVVAWGLADPLARLARLAPLTRLAPAGRSRRPRWPFTPGITPDEALSPRPRPPTPAAANPAAPGTITIMIRLVTTRPAPPQSPVIKIGPVTSGPGTPAITRDHDPARDHPARHPPNHP
jgi:hypothetical protein